MEITLSPEAIALVQRRGGVMALDGIVQAAIRCISAGSMPSAPSTTATGLPRSGRAVKTSTCLNRYVDMLTLLWRGSRGFRWRMRGCFRVYRRSISIVAPREDAAMRLP